MNGCNERCKTLNIPEEGYDLKFVYEYNEAA